MPVSFVGNLKTAALLVSFAAFFFGDVTHGGALRDFPNNGCVTFFYKNANREATDFWWKFSFVLADLKQNWIEFYLLAFNSCWLSRRTFRFSCSFYPKYHEWSYLTSSYCCLGEFIVQSVHFKVLFSHLRWRQGRGQSFWVTWSER